MNPGRSCATTTPLPRRRSRKVPQLRDDGRVGVGRGNHLDERQVARRVEKVGAEEPRPVGRRSNTCATWAIGIPEVLVLTMVRGPRCGASRSSRRVLEVELFDDGLDDPVRFRGVRDAVIERPGPDREPAVSGRKNGSGFGLAGAIEAGSGGVSGDVQQQHGEPGVGEVRGDLRAHRSGAEHRGGLNHRAPFAGTPKPPTRMSTISSACPSSA